MPGTDIVAEPEVAPPKSDLTFVRTIDRSLVHRYSVNEVFITDMVPMDSGQYLLAAQLPLSHGYFLDSARRPARYGVALLAECTRQACTYLAHVGFDVPQGWTFLMSDMSAELHDSAALLVGDRPAELTMVASPEAVIRGGRARALTVALDLWLGGTLVGRMSGSGMYTTYEEYDFLRAGARGGTAVPLSTSLPDGSGGVPVPPALVGRGDPRNVVLVDGRATGDGAAARLSVWGRHPTIFDHPLDHYPGMALIEGAVQTTLLALALRDPSAPAARIVALGGSFGRFAELDADVQLRAVLNGPAGAAEVPARVIFTQSGSVIATLRVVASRPPADETAQAGGAQGDAAPDTAGKGATT
jgi:hypothetical protein